MKETGTFIQKQFYDASATGDHRSDRHRERQFAVTSTVCSEYVLRMDTAKILRDIGRVCIGYAQVCFAQLCDKRIQVSRGTGQTHRLEHAPRRGPTVGEGDRTHEDGRRGDRWSSRSHRE